MFIGKIILNWLQTQSSDSTNKFHFNFFIISNEIGNHNQVHPISLVRELFTWENFSKILGISSFFIQIQLSLIIIINFLFNTKLIISIFQKLFVNFTAFQIIFTKTCLNLCKSV